MWRLAALLALGGCTVHGLASEVENVDHPEWTDKYDPHFRKYAKRYFGPAFDWRWFKAQGIAESGLDPKARSPVGAVGVMQIMPATYGEIRDANPHFSSVKDPRWNIAAGIYYDRQLYKRWHGKIHPQDRVNVTFAAYNAGFGTVNKARRKISGKGQQPDSWPHIAKLVPGQTRHYVKRIRRLMGH